MRSFLLLTETGPVLLLTKCTAVTEEGFLENLNERGIKKFIAFEVPVDKAGAYTPVPGGVGPMTINTLIMQSVESAEKSLG